MPTSPQPAGPEPAEGAPSPVMPPSVRVAAITMGVLAALLLVNAGLLWYGFDATVDRIESVQDGITEADARRFVLLALIPYLVLGLILALAAWFLPRRQPWARWIGLAGSFVLGAADPVLDDRRGRRDRLVAAAVRALGRGRHEPARPHDRDLGAPAAQPLNAGSALAGRPLPAAEPVPLVGRLHRQQDDGRDRAAAAGRRSGR